MFLKSTELLKVCVGCSSLNAIVFVLFYARVCLSLVMSLVLIEASIVLMLVFLRKRVCIAIALLKEGSK